MSRKFHVIRYKYLRTLAIVAYRTFQGPRLSDQGSSAIADHVKARAGHNIKWDHFDIVALGKTDLHCNIKETLFIQELQPSLNVNVSSEKLILY